MTSKYLFAALTAATSIVIASCSDDYASVSQRGGEVDVTYTLNTQALPQTRATHDVDGDAANVNRYVCEVWHVNGQSSSLYKRVENVVAEGTLQTTFNLRLVASQDYKVLFWADHATVSGEGQVGVNNVTATDLYYETNAADAAKGLKEVEIKQQGTPAAYVGNNDAMDAFYGTHEIDNLAGTLNASVTLKRPFAQLNVITTDIDDIKASSMASTMEPDKATLTVNAPTKFNVWDGSTSEFTNLAYTADVYYGISQQNKKESTAADYTYCTLTMSYILAPADEKTVETVKLDALNGETTLTSPEFTNIPLQRNYRTNIIGNLLTDGVTYTVNIDPLWQTPEYDVNITRVADIAAANEALSSGTSSNIEITAPTDAATQAVVFTAANDDKDYTLNISGAVSGNTVTIKNDAPATAGPASVTVVAPAGTNLIFENETHVVLNGTDYGTVSGSFAANTLVISRGVTVGKLDITKGAVEVYGTLNDLAVSGNEVLFRTCHNLPEAVYQTAKSYIATGFTAAQNEDGTWNIERVIKAKIGNREFATLNEAMAAAQNGDVVEVMEGEFSYHNINNKGNITLKGQGADKTTWIHSTSGYDNHAGTVVNFKDMKIAAITATGSNAGYKGFGHSAGLTFENCEFVGMITHWGGNFAHFKNCTFTPLAGEYAMWTYGVREMKFEGCQFTSINGKAVNVYCESTSNNPCTYSFKNCSFTNTAHKTSGSADVCKPALAIKNNGNGTGATKPSYYVVNLDNCTFEGYGQSDGDLYGFPTEAPYVNAYGYNSQTAPLKVVVDGVTRVNIGIAE